MSKSFNTVVRSQFAVAMAAAAPQFAPTKVVAKHAWPGERAFAWKAREGLFCWVSLITSHKGYNEFFIEVGWSALGRYPELSSRPTFAPIESEATVHDYPEVMFRLSSLGEVTGEWKYRPAEIDLAPEGEQFMLEVKAALLDLSPEEADLAVKPMVAEAIASLTRVGIPFLERNAYSALFP